MLIMKTIKIYLGFLTTTLLLSACYSYGPTHIPYGYKPLKELPPPPAKIVAAPLSKSEYMEKTYTEVKETLTEADVELIDDSIKVLFPNNIIYQTKDILPSSDYLPSLQKFAELLNKYTKTDILVTGHSDNKGNPQKNKELSQVRADNIKHILVSKGIKSYRMESWGLGASSPIDDNSTIEGRAKNRRVEFIVLYDDK